MGAEDITQSDLLAEVAEFLRDNTPHRPGPDWFTVGELLVSARVAEPDLTGDQLRKRLDKMVAKRTFEKVSQGRNTAYFRMVK